VRTSLRLHEEATQEHPSGGGAALRRVLRHGALAGRHAHQLPDHQEADQRLKELEQGTAEGEFENYTKKEQLLFERERVKLEKYLSASRT